MKNKKFLGAILIVYSRYLDHSSKAYRNCDYLKIYLTSLPSFKIWT